MLRRVALAGLLISLVLLSASALAQPARGRSVEVLWGGSWWAAEVVESRAGLTKIHYTGWGPEWDEWVEPERVRAAAPRAALGTVKAGERIEVLWGGTWWAAEVMQTRAGLTKIHYTGWGPEWDEWIEPNRMRAVAAAKPTPKRVSLTKVAKKPQRVQLAR